MSNYPPPQYGGGYGTPDQSNMPYLPPAYPQQYYQQDSTRGAHVQMNTQMNAATGNYNSYGYNHLAPGFNSTVGAPAISPMPIFQGWNQDSLPLPPFTTAPQQSSYSAYNGAYQQTQYGVPANQNSWSQPPANNAKAVEQSDLSEGEYDDSAMPNNHVSSQDYSTAHFQQNSSIAQSRQPPVNGRFNHEGSPSHQSSTYGNGHLPIEPQPLPSARRDSDSYSPHLSPGLNHHVRIQSAQAESVPISKTSNGRGERFNSQFTSPRTRHDLHDPTPTNSALHKSSDPHPPISASVTQPIVKATLSSRSMEEGKKKAQGAILNLLAYDVHYDTYINEGFREDIIAKLFDGLNMPHASLTRPEDSADNHSKSQRITPPRYNNLSQAAAIGLNHGSTAALLGVDSPSTISPAVASNTSKPAASKVSPKQPAELSEKDRKIQAKMDALKKSREARSQKQAAEKDTRPISPPVAAAPTSRETTSHVEPTSEPAPVIDSSVEPIVESIILTDTANKITTQDAIANTPAVSTLPQVSSVPVPDSIQPAMAIPGLFLSSNRPNTLPHTVQQHSTAISPLIVKKRPVAADFDNLVPTHNPLKRPFGYPRSKTSLVITVSDEEDSQDEDVAMDIDSDAEQNSPAQAFKVLPTQQQPSKPRPDYAHQMLTSSGSSGFNTPTFMSQLKAKEQAELARREKEILDLKRAIAKKEAARRQTPSGRQTPLPTPSVVTEVIPAKIENSLIPTITEDALPSANGSLVVSPSQLEQEDSDSMELDDSETDHQLSQAEEEANRDVQRRAQEVEQSQKAARDLLAEVARIQALTDDAEKQLQEAQAKAQRLQAKKRRRSQRQGLALQENLNQEGKFTDDSIAAKPLVPEDVTVVEPSQELPETVEIETNNHELPPRPMSSASVASNKLPANADVGNSITPPTVQETTLLAGAKEIDAILEDHSANDEPITEAHQVSEASIKENTSADDVLEANLQEAIRAQADPPSPEEGEIDMDMEMSSPAPEATPLPTSIADAGEELKITTSDRPASVVSDDDDYEPPEATPPPPESSPSDSAINNEDTITFDAEPIHDNLHVISDHTSRDAVENDQPVAPLGESVTQQAEVPREQRSTPFFTPYESPLKRFHAFRFHPQFAEQVAGGLRSLTYSNKIDASNELCRYESAGGICNDNTCAELHFKDMKIPDDAILTALGSPEQFADARHDEFCNGLRNLLMDLRKRKIRDFDVIASEIIAYRAKFLADVSKILPLEGVVL